MTTQLLSKKRFESLPSVQFINQKLDIGKAIKKLLLKYFKKKIIGSGINTMPSEKGYKFIPLYDYYRWQDNKASDKNSIDEWKRELFDNYKDYHNPLNSVYIRIGIEIHKAALSRLDVLDEEGKRELLYGGGTTSFMIGVDFVDTFRRFGKDLTRVGFKYNKEGIMSIFRAPKPPPPDAPEPINAAEQQRLFQEVIESFQRDKPRGEITESKTLNDVLGRTLQLAEANRLKLEKKTQEAQKTFNDIAELRKMQQESLEKLQSSRKRKGKKTGNGITFTDFVRFYKKQPKEATAKDILDSWAKHILHTDYKKLAKNFDTSELFSIYLANRLAMVLTQQRERLKKYYENFPS